MATSQNPSYRAKSQYPADDRWLSWDGTVFTPYEDIAAALAAIPEDRRHIGLFVLIDNVLHWFEEGTTDDKLVEFPIGQWGKIRGVLDDQIDLKNALDNKAPLVGGLIPSMYLPSSVDDVVEYADFASLPVTGEAGKLYITLDDGKIYRWSGSTYVLTGGSPVPLATETSAGIAEIATNAEAAAGTDDERMITPAKLKHVLDMLSFSWGGIGGNIADQTDLIALLASLTTDDITEASNLYFTQARVLAVALTGLFSVNSPITATDTILEAFGKCQGQLAGLAADMAYYLPLAGGTLAGFLTLHADPVSPMHPVTKNYFDAYVTTNITWKTEARVASTGNLVLSGVQTVDGVTGLADSRILVKDQTNPIQNGIYLMKSGAWVRTDDADTGAEIESATLLVRLGTTQADQQFSCSNSTTPVIGSDAINFVRITAGSAYVNGTYLSLTGNIFDIDFSTFSTTQISEGSKLFFTNARAIAAPLTGFISAPGGVSAADTILQALQKIDGNVALLQGQIGQVQIGNSLFNYYNLR